MIPYLGNKSGLSDFIKPHIPKNIETYIEPFGGGFNLFFTLDLNDYPNTQFIYNDINPLNSNLFEHLKKDTFIKKIKLVTVTKEIFENAYLNLESTNKNIKALSWIIILCCCGDIKNIMNKDFKGSSGFEIFKYKISHYSEYFKRIKVLNLDYKKIFKKFDNDNAFFYLDPPYVGYENYYINHNFIGDSSHIELSNELKKLKGKWVLSYYNFDNLPILYNDYKILSKKHNLGEEYLIIS